MTAVAAVGMPAKGTNFMFVTMSPLAMPATIATKPRRNNLAPPSDILLAQSENRIACISRTEKLKRAIKHPPRAESI